MDDATSAVDPRVEAAILAGLRAPGGAGASDRGGRGGEAAPGGGEAYAAPGGGDAYAAPSGGEAYPAPTVVVVAYRKATIALADEVVYVENGRVVDRGPHAELVERCEGYRQLITAYEREEAERAAVDAEVDADVAVVDAEVDADMAAE